ncbi:MAG: hypothetical protein WEC75_09950 [Dehalococcoidia bacterium]
MERLPLRAEQLLTLSSAGRRLSDLVAASREPVHYEVLRHLLRVSEETMTEVLEETIRLQLVRRGDGPFTYVPFDENTGAKIAGEMGQERLARLRQQIEGATRRVFEVG